MPLNPGWTQTATGFQYTPSKVLAPLSPDPIPSKDSSTQSAIDLSTQLNPLYISNFKSAMEAVAPGSGASVAANIGSLIKGQIPKDVLDQITQSSAEMNLSQGRFGEAANFTAARNIGKTSLDLTQMGLGDLSKMMPNLPDLATLVQQSRQYDLSRNAQELGASEAAARLAQSQSAFAEQSAMDRMRLALNANSQAFSQGQAASAVSERAHEFDASLAWEKQLSAFNQNYEKWATGQNQALAQQIIQQKNQQAGDAGSSFMKSLTDTLKNTFAQNTSSAPSASTSIGPSSPDPEWQYPNVGKLWGNEPAKPKNPDVTITNEDGTAPVGQGA